MTTLKNKYDAIESLIFDNNLRITTIEIKSEINTILVFLNTNHILALSLSQYKNLKEASAKDLQKFELIANGTGIHWPKLDEDLSLKGFLKDALKQLVVERQLIVA